MTCGGCVAKVKSLLESNPDIISAEPDLKTGQLEIKATEELSSDNLNEILKDHPKYRISPSKTETKKPESFSNISSDLPEITLATYKPLFMIVGFIILVSAMVQYPFSDFSWMLFMRHFMAGFFITFSFFKLLNLSGFASSYQMYDVIAKAIPFWAFLYPFIELGLGLLYLTDIQPYFTNIATIVILGTASIGVIQSNLQKRKIKCACLGDFFNLPMSTVTIIEDVTMVAMAVVMLLLL